MMDPNEDVVGLDLRDHIAYPSRFGRAEMPIAMESVRVIRRVDGSPGFVDYEVACAGVHEQKSPALHLDDSGCRDRGSPHRGGKSRILVVIAGNHVDGAGEAGEGIGGFLVLG